MSGYNMHYFVKDFSDRTKKNTHILERSGNAYEVTHLLNSLFGLIIIPHEAYYIKAKSLGCAKKYSDKMKKIDDIISECISDNKYYCDYNDEVQNAVSFIHHIRNSLAHGGNEGILFCPVQGGAAEKITSIIFYDSDEHFKNSDPNNIHKFCVELSISQLNKFVKYTNDLFVSIDSEAETNDWEERADNFRKLFSISHKNYTKNEEYIISGNNYSY